ncbi:unnamed protein product [Arctogadus glacialis]
MEQTKLVPPDRFNPVNQVAVGTGDEGGAEGAQRRVSGTRVPGGGEFTSERETKKKEKRRNSSDQRDAMRPTAEDSDDKARRN